MPKLRPELLRELTAGLAHHQAGRLDDAATAYQRVLQSVPNEPDALNLLGVIAQAKGRPARAVQLISQALRARPHFPEAMTNLARAQRAAGDPEGAASMARRAIELAPELAEAHEQLGRILLDLNEDEGAAEACRRAVELAPRSLDARVNLGAALTRLKDYQAAAVAYQEAHRLDPERADTLTDFGAALTELDRFDDAVRCHERALARDPNSTRALAALAATLKRAQRPVEAVEACRRTLALVPGDTDVWVLLGGCLAALGRFDEAVDAYRQALDVDPECAEAQRGIVAAGERTQDVAELARLRAVADDAETPVHHRIAASYALGALLDKSGEYDDSFRHIATANQLKRAFWREAGEEEFSRDGFRRLVDGMIATFKPAVFAATRDWGDPSELPVFIVGMPRSGTTLTEQILASHPAVFGGGERKDIGRIAHLLASEHLGQSPLVWDRAKVRREAEQHLEQLRGFAGAALRVTDKMPDNIQLLGTIALLFPRARVVICRRDLRDVCLSCHFQAFGQGMSWTTDLADCAFRALEVERLVRHWQKVLPLNLFELTYEELVGDLEGQGRRLVDFLGLPWDPACLAFHTTERQVMTASLWQVRQPLYSTSIGRWRHYAGHLAPLLTPLEAGLRDLADASQTDAARAGTAA
jgi:tetratricopeptide (TPR) repeat protein